MSLTIKELDSLLNLISFDLTNSQTFETIANILHSALTKVSPFKICSILVFFLRHSSDLLPTSQQKLAAFFLIFECYKNEEFINNPFATIFKDLLLNKNDNSEDSQYKEDYPRLNEKEKIFITHLISNSLPIKDLIKLTPKQALNMDETPINKSELNNILTKVIKKEINFPETCTSAISVIVNEPNGEKINFSNDKLSKNKLIKDLLTYEPPYLELSYIPEVLRLTPIINIQQKEFYWSLPNELDNLEFLWDNTMNSDININSDYCLESFEKTSQLMNKAFNEMLTLVDEQVLIKKLKEDEDSVNNLGLTPSKFVKLVDNNPLIAIEVLLILIKTREISEYISVLVNMEMSVHSMEVLNRLTSVIECPNDLIIEYINKCISTCEQIRDNSTQCRMVRLVCVFLQSLIKNKIVDVKNVVIEVETFCIQFSRVREASTLFRLIKNQDLNDMELNSTNNSNN